MPVETLTAILVHPSNLSFVNARFTPKNTFMFAESKTDLEVGSWIVTLEVVTNDPFNDGWTRRAEWNWNVNKVDLELKYEPTPMANQPHRFMLHPK